MKPAILWLRLPFQAVFAAAVAWGAIAGGRRRP